MCKEVYVFVLNPLGAKIDLPFWVFKRLKKLHLLERDRETGRWRICARVFGLMETWETPGSRPGRALKALSMGSRLTRSGSHTTSSYPRKEIGKGLCTKGFFDSTVQTGKLAAIPHP
jgi:hypothetical protein